jgi:hypothetical protein
MTAAGQVLALGGQGVRLLLQLLLPLSKTPALLEGVV